MAIYVRNLVSLDTVNPGTSLFSAHHIVLLRELFLAGRWTQSAISNAGSWDANIVKTNTDCVVSAASPGRITSATGGLTGYENYGITLLGGVSDSDNNRGVYRIKRVISANEIEVRSPPPNGWVSDTGMTCRIFNWGFGNPLTGAEYVVMDAPAGNNQAHISKTATSYYFYFQAHPRGDYPSNATPSRVMMLSSSAKNATWNVYFNGSVAFVFFLDNFSTNWFAFLYGELENVAPTDTYPGFFSYGINPTTFDFGSTAPVLDGLGYLDMLYDNGGIGQQTAYIANIVKPDGNYLTQQQTIELCRKVKGKLQFVKPWVYADGANGGYFRGRHPFRTTNLHGEKWRSMILDGTWRRYENTGVFPMNGVNDLLPFPGVPAW